MRDNYGQTAYLRGDTRYVGIRQVLARSHNTYNIRNGDPVRSRSYRGAVNAYRRI